MEELSDNCNDDLWHYRKKITEESGFLALVKEACGSDIVDQTSCSEKERKMGHGFVSCVIDNKDKLTNLKCQTLITRLEGVIFADFEVIEKFADTCQSDIRKFGCGRNEIPGVGTAKQHVSMTII